MIEKIKSPLQGGAKQQDVLFVALSAMTLPVLFGYYFIATLIEPDADGAFLDNAVMIVMFFLCLALTLVAVKKDCVQKIAPIISLLIIVMIIPEDVSVRGRLSYGDITWFLVGVLYIAIIVEGRKKYVFLAIEALMAALMHWVYYDIDVSTVTTIWSRPMRW